MKTKFNELSWPTRIGIVGGWVALIIYALAFLIGFVAELLI